MPIRFDQIINDITNNTYLDNPIIVGLIILIIMMLIIYLNFYEDKKNNNFWITLFRIGFYTSFPIMLILFLHYKHVENNFDSKLENTKTNELITAATTKGAIKADYLTNS